MTLTSIPLKYLKTNSYKKFFYNFFKVCNFNTRKDSLWKSFKGPINPFCKYWNKRTRICKSKRKTSLYICSKEFKYASVTVSRLVNYSKKGQNRPCSLKYTCTCFPRLSHECECCPILMRVYIHSSFYILYIGTRRHNPLNFKHKTKPFRIETWKLGKLSHLAAGFVSEALSDSFFLYVNTV